jgi:hypothetical protein
VGEVTSQELVATTRCPQRSAYTSAAQHLALHCSSAASSKRLQQLRAQLLNKQAAVYLSFFLGRSWLVWPHFFFLVRSKEEQMQEQARNHGQQQAYQVTPTRALGL